jgi:nucleoside-diphosphate-sugar epimerase
MEPSTLIFGCGYVGRRVAHRLRSGGQTVYTLTRSPQRAAAFAADGFVPVIGDWLRPSTLRNLPRSPVALVAVGRDPGTRIDFHHWYVDGLRHALDALDPSTRIVYLSSTGVYHQDGDQWVDENSPCRPRRGGGAAHLAAEALLRSRRPRGGAAILRLAGIYGPGRLPRIADIRRGLPLAVGSDGYVNLIHADDAAAATASAILRPPPERLYAVADGHPVRRRMFYQAVAALIGAPSPSFADAAPAGRLPVAAQRRGENSKRIWNRRMLRDLLPHLQYPDYRSGLRQALREHPPSTADD